MFFAKAVSKHDAGRYVHHLRTGCNGVTRDLFSHGFLCNEHNGWNSTDAVDVKSHILLKLFTLRTAAHILLEQSFYNLTLSSTTSLVSQHVGPNIFF